MNSGDLRDAWTRLLHAMEGVEDVSVLIGQSDREQAARLRQIAQAIEAEAPASFNPSPAVNGAMADVEQHGSLGIRRRPNWGDVQICPRPLRHCRQPCRDHPPEARGLDAATVATVATVATRGDLKFPSPRCLP